VHVCTHQAKYVNILPYVSLRSAYSTRRTASSLGNKGFTLTWYRALTWYASPARLFTAPDVPLLVTGQQGSLSPACRQLSRARNACAEGSSEGSTNLMHGTKLGRTLAVLAGCSSYRRSTPSPPSCGLSPPPRYPYRLLFIPDGNSVSAELRLLQQAKTCIQFHMVLFAPRIRHRRPPPLGIFTGCYSYQRVTPSPPSFGLPPPLGIFTGCYSYRRVTPYPPSFGFCSRLKLAYNFICFSSLRVFDTYDPLPSVSLQAAIHTGGSLRIRRASASAADWAGARHFARRLPLVRRGQGRGCHRGRRRGCVAQHCAWARPAKGAYLDLSLCMYIYR